MADSTKAVVVKAGDGTVVPPTFFADNSAALRAALVLTNITEIEWVAAKGGLVITTAADGDVFVPCYQVPA